LLHSLLKVVCKWLFANDWLVYSDAVEQRWSVSRSRQCFHQLLHW